MGPSCCCATCGWTVGESRCRGLGASLAADAKTALERRGLRTNSSRTNFWKRTLSFSRSICMMHASYELR